MWFALHFQWEKRWKPWLVSPWVAGPLGSQKFLCLKVICYIWPIRQARLSQSYFLYPNIIKKMVNKFSVSFLSCLHLESDFWVEIACAVLKKQEWESDFHAQGREGGAPHKPEVKDAPSETQREACDVLSEMHHLLLISHSHMEGRLQQGNPAAEVEERGRWEELFPVSRLVGQCHQLSFTQFLQVSSVAGRAPKCDWHLLCRWPSRAGRRGQGTVLLVTGASCSRWVCRHRLAHLPVCPSTHP